MRPVLDQYIDLRKSLISQAPELAPIQLFQYQEAAYRIEVLQYFQLLMHTAPRSLDIKRLSEHYGAMDAMISHLIAERRYRQAADKDIQTARDTARAALISVITAYRQRFSGYMPEREDQYREDIAGTICTVLPAWLQYRETMLPINQETEGE